MNLSNRIRLLFLVLLCGLMTIGDCKSTLQGLRVKIGDELSIQVVGVALSDPSAQGPTSAGPRYPVFSDGTINSHEFGILHVAGLKLSEVAKLVRDKLAQRYKNPIVSVVLDSESPEFVYLSGTKAVNGEVRLIPGMDVRRLLASVQLDDAPDQSEAHIFRAGQPEKVALVQDILSGTSPLASFKLAGDDVVTVLPLAFIRVWVTGDVVHPGQVTVPKGGDVYLALAAVGGANPLPSVGNDPRLSVRRGPVTQFFSLKQDPKAPDYPLEPGDSIVVSTGTHITVTVSGEVKTPGMQQLPSNAVLDQAIAAAGGLTWAGTGRGVTVLREGKTFTAGVASSTDPVGLGSFQLRDQDVVLVNQNTRFVIAVGLVKTQGRVYIPDGQPLYLIDAIGLAGGIADKGTPRHVFVGHANDKGKMVIKEYRLDSYEKNGDPAGNPLLAPGDIFTVQAAKDTTLDAVQQILTGGVLLYGVTRF